MRTKEPRNLGSDNYEVTMHFSGGLWELDSAICFHHAEAKVAGHIVQLKVYTGLCGRRSPRIHSFRVKGLTQAEYDLVYVDPDGTKHAVGTLCLKANP